MDYDDKKRNAFELTNHSRNVPMKRMFKIDVSKKFTDEEIKELLAKYRNAIQKIPPIK